MLFGDGPRGGPLRLLACCPHSERFFRSAWLKDLGECGVKGAVGIDDTVFCCEY